MFLVLTIHWLLYRRGCSAGLCKLDQQKQPPEVFYKKSFSLKCLNILRRKPVLESLFNEETLTQIFPCESYTFLRKFILKNICERLLLYQLFIQNISWQHVFNFTTALCENLHICPDTCSPSAQYRMLLLIYNTSLNYTQPYFLITIVVCV